MAGFFENRGGCTAIMKVNTDVIAGLRWVKSSLGAMSDRLESAN